MLYRFIFTDGPAADTVRELLEVSAPTLREAWATAADALADFPTSGPRYPARIEYGCDACRAWIARMVEKGNGFLYRYTLTPCGRCGTPAHATYATLAPDREAR